MDNNITTPAGDTVPRQWYETQREALHREEMRNVALLARITELHREIERLSKRAGPAAERASGQEHGRIAAEPRPQAQTRPKAEPQRKVAAGPQIIDLTI